jgi:hypothetical protein
MKPRWYERWQTFLVLGLLMTAGSVFVFWDLAEWEADPNGGAKSMNWFAALLYRIGGKWLLSAAVLAVGVILTVAGVHRRRVQRARAGQPPAPPPAEGDG